MTESWHGQPGEPGEQGEQGERGGGTGGRGGAGGAGGDAVGLEAMQDQLAWVRQQEEKTHRQRRLTNWLVTLLSLFTLVVVLVGGWVLHSRIDHEVDLTNLNHAAVLKVIANQQIVIANQQKLCAAAHITCKTVP